MKKLAVILILFSELLSAQCDERTEAPTFANVPTFISLFNRGMCISGVIRDTIVCVQVEPSNVNRIALFSFSSPNGTGVTVNGIKVYDEDCTLISQGNEIPASSEEYTVCYSLTADWIDNFCPYMLRLNPLFVEWGTVSCAYESGNLSVSFSTLSNQNTAYFEVWTSQDAAMWRRIGVVPPKQVTNSSESNYVFSLRAGISGLNYFMVREVDLNGEISVAPICYLDAGANLLQSPGFDVLGRQVQNADYFYYIRR